MKSEVLKKIKGLKKDDVVKIKTSLDSRQINCLVISINIKRNSMEVLPLDKYAASSADVFIPYLAYPFHIIDNLEVVDKSFLLYLIDKDNPHISSAIERMRC